MRRIGLIAVLAVVVLSQVPARRASAIGGDDGSPSDKVDAVTQSCQAQIAKLGAGYAAAVAKAVNG
jgi:hypothetical protein